MLNNLGLGLTITAKDLSKAAFEQVQGSLGLTGVKVGELEKETRQASEVFERASLAMVAGGAAIFAGIGLAVSKAHDLEQAFKLVSTRANEATLPMAAVRDLALDLSNAFGLDQAEIARGQYEAIAKGATDVASQQAVMTASARLAVGAQIPLNEALDATTQVLRAFHLPMADAALVTDQLITASERGAGTIAELSGALEHIAPGAARAGLSSGDLLGAVTALSNAGLKGRAAIGGLRAVIDALVQPSDAAKQQAAALGISLDASKIAAQGFVPWVQQLAGNTKLTSEAMGKLFGSAEATTAAMALMRNGGADLAETLGTMTGATGAAADAAATMTDEWARSKTLVTNALAALGRAFLPLTNAVVKPLNAAVEWFTKLSPATQKMIAVGLAFAGATLVIAGGIAGMTAAVATFGATIFPVFLAAASLIAPVAAGLAGLAAAAYVVKVAWDHDFAGIRTTVTAFYEKVRLVWDGLVQLFTRGGFSGAVYSEINKAGNGGLKNFVVDVFLWAHRIKAAWDGLSSGIAAGFEAFRPATEALRQIISGLSEAFGQLFGYLFGGQNDVQKNISAFQVFAAVGAALGESLGGLVRVAGLLLTIGLAPLRLAIAALTGGWRGFGHAALEVFADVVKGVLGVGGAVAGVVDQIAGAFGKKLNLSKTVEDFAKTADLGIRPSVAGGAAPVEGAPISVPSARIGRDSAAVQEAYAAGARLRGGEGGAGAASDRAFVERMIPILEEIRKNGNNPVVVQLDGEVLAQSAKSNREAHAARAFAPAPAPR